MKDKTSTVETLYLPGTDAIPNNPALPVLVYRQVAGAEDEPDRAAAFERRFAASGWGGLWRNGIYDYHHFHPNAHEALGIAEGGVTVLLGGETGEEVRLAAGDLVVLPAGTGHKRLGVEGRLLVVGAYPPGQEDYDTCRGLDECPDAAKQVEAVALPAADPFYGETGSLPQIWGGKTE